MSRILHLQTLIDNGACASQVALFRELYGDKVRVTQKLCVAVADKFSFDWAAIKLLSAPAWAEYGRVMARTFAKCYNEDPKR